MRRGGRARPERPEKVIGWSECRITGETAAACADVISAIDNARLPFLPDGPLVTGGSGEGGQGEDKPKKRGGRREAVECACQPPRKLHMTPRQIEDGPVICGVCTGPCEAPEAGGDEAE